MLGSFAVLKPADEPARPSAPDEPPAKGLTPPEENKENQDIEGMTLGQYMGAGPEPDTPTPLGDDELEDDAQIADDQCDGQRRKNESGGND